MSTENNILENTRRFRAKIAAGRICLGVQVGFTDPQVTEVLCGCDYDFIWIETEHSPMSLETIHRHVAIVTAAGLMAMVRVPVCDPILIKPLLEMGANGIIVPNVKTAAEARTVVAACMYPPKGIRGYGPRQATNFGRLTDYHLDADECIFTVVQIESPEGVANLDEMLEIADLDSVTIGPMDLSFTMGYPANPRHPEVEAAMNSIIERTRAAGKVIGFPLSGDPAQAADRVKRGVQWLAVTNDFDLLRQSDEMIDNLRNRFSVL